MPQPSFEQLSQDLSPFEKKALLEKVRTSLNLEQKDAESIIGQGTSSEDRHDKLMQELKQLTFWPRLWLRIQAFFIGKDLEGTLLWRKFRKITAQIVLQSPELYHASANSLTEGFARRVYDVYVEVLKLRPVFETIFKESSVMESAITALIESEVPEPKKSLFDIAEADEWEELYRRSGEKAHLHKKLRDAIPAYIRSIPHKAFEMVKRELRPVYFLKNLLFYPFHAVLDYMGHNPQGLPIQKYPAFSPMSVIRAPELLEKLFYSLYVATKIQWDPEPLRFLFQQALAKIQSLPEKPLRVEPPKTVEEVLTQVASLLQDVERFFLEAPWKEIILLSREDPYYKFRIYLPSYHVREYYQAFLTLKWAAQLDEEFPLIRKRIIETEKNFIFQSQYASFLEHYNGVLPPAAVNFQLPHFQHSESLNVIHSFLGSFFNSQYLPLIQTLSRIVLQQSRGILSNIMSMATDLESIRERILTFDRSLSPDGEDGKSLIRLRGELSTKAASHRVYTALIHKKDREAVEIIARAIEQLSALADIFEGLLKNSTPQMRNLLKIPYLLSGAKTKLSDVLEAKAALLRKVLHLLKELGVTVPK